LVLPETDRAVGQLTVAESPAFMLMVDEAAKAPETAMTTPPSKAPAAPTAPNFQWFMILPFLG
jgi:hypothetical protein